MVRMMRIEQGVRRRKRTTSMFWYTWNCCNCCPWTSCKTRPSFWACWRRTCVLGGVVRGLVGDRDIYARRDLAACRRVGTRVRAFAEQALLHAAGGAARRPPTWVCNQFGSYVKQCRPGYGISRSLLIEQMAASETRGGQWTSSAKRSTRREDGRTTPWKPHKRNRRPLPRSRTVTRGRSRSHKGGGGALGPGDQEHERPVLRSGDRNQRAPQLRRRKQRPVYKAERSQPQISVASMPMPFLLLLFFWISLHVPLEFRRAPATSATSRNSIEPPRRLRRPEMIGPPWNGTRYRFGVFWDATLGVRRASRLSSTGQRLTAAPSGTCWSAPRPPARRGSTVPLSSRTPRRQGRSMTTSTSKTNSDIW